MADHRRVDRDRETIEWVEDALGQRVTSISELPGGMSSVVRRCDLADRSAIVVRDITDQAWLDRDPDLITREARALDLLAPSPVPAPALIACDARAGRLLMTFVPGALRTTKADLAPSVMALGALAASVGAVELPLDHGLPPWRPWTPDRLEAPGWGDRVLWEEAIAVFASRSAPVTDHPRLLHRDLHPLNVLWRGDDVAALVDWVNACVGHPHAELGHCRWNLRVLADAATADAFSAHAVERSGGEPYDRWWDLATAVGLLPGPIGALGWRAVGRRELDDAAVVAATEGFVRSALTEW